MDLFCPECGSMMFPKDGMYVCRNKACGHTEEITGKAQVYTDDAGNKETAVVSDVGATLNRIRTTCPKCGYSEAYFSTRQTRSADEPATTFFRCCKCSYSWREYRSPGRDDR